jgi:hypothetical protein
MRKDIFFFIMFKLLGLRNFRSSWAKRAFATQNDSLIQKVKTQAKQYFDGVKLLLEETKRAKLLKVEVEQRGLELSRNQYRLVNCLLM